MMLKLLEKEKCRELRRQGLSLSDIVREVGVSRDSVCRWVRDIALSEEQMLNLGYNGFKGGKLCSFLNISHHQFLVDKYREEGRAAASGGDNLHRMCCMLYWAEGAKTGNSVRFTNGSPAMLKFFMRFLREFFHIPDSSIKIHLTWYCDNGNTLEDTKHFWQKELGVEPSCFRKVKVLSPPRKSRKIGKHPCGFVEIRVGDFRIFHHLMGAINEYYAYAKKPITTS